MDLYAAMRIFVRVAEARSFSGIARELNVAQSTVSKQISALEEHLGARLVSRTTRTLSLTDEGHQFYERSREILDAIAEAETTVGSGKLSPSGLVRLGCPATFGRLLIAPRLARLLAEYPELRVELVMNDAFADLVAEGLDLVVRIGVLADQNLIARRVGTTYRGIFGSPTYFAERGLPKTPHDLRNHNCIVYTNLGTGNEWRFAGPQRRFNVRVQGNFLANNAEAIREAVLSSIGVAAAPTWMFHREWRQGWSPACFGNTNWSRCRFTLSFRRAASFRQRFARSRTFWPRNFKPIRRLPPWLRSITRVQRPDIRGAEKRKLSLLPTDERATI